MPYPYIPENTNRRFYVPKTLAADFDEFLENDIPNMVMDFELLHNWYDKNEEQYVPSYIRGEIYANTTKSRYSNTDNNLNFRASLTSGIQKGDMIVQPDGEIFVLDWEVAKESNNSPSRALRCNMILNIFRHHEEIVDEEGMLIEEEGTTTIVNDIPANAYRYDGRPEYSAVSGTPGVTPGALTLMTVQYNDQTKNIRIDDKFIWGNVEYQVVDVNMVGVSLDEMHGVLFLQAKKASGGLL